MDHGDDLAAGTRPSDLPRRMPDVRTYGDDDVVWSADGEWQIGDADDYTWWSCICWETLFTTQL